MTALTTRDALKRELQRHIGAHADIVANALLASGAVIDVATLADDEALTCGECSHPLDDHGRAGCLDSMNHGERDNLGFCTCSLTPMRALTAALTKRGTA